MTVAVASIDSSLGAIIRNILVKFSLTRWNWYSATCPRWKIGSNDTFRLIKDSFYFCHGDANRNNIFGLLWCKRTANAARSLPPSLAVFAPVQPRRHKTHRRTRICQSPLLLFIQLLWKSTPSRESIGNSFQNKSENWGKNPNDTFPSTQFDAIIVRLSPATKGEETQETFPVPPRAH